MTGTAAIPLQMVGESAVVCVGDACEIPAARDQAIVNQLLDDGAV